VKQTRFPVRVPSIIFTAFLSLACQGLLIPSHSFALPIETDTALTVGFESNAIRSFARVIHKKSLLRGGDEIFDPENREVTIYKTPLIIPLRITPNLVAVGILPLLTIETERTLAGNRLENSASGPGDIQLLLKHAFYKKDALKATTRLAWIAGIKLPTGDETEIPAIGSGSVDFIIGGILTHIVDRFAIHADLKYKINTEARGVRVGNALKHDLAFEYRIIPSRFRSISDKTVNLILELNGLYVEQSKLIGGKIENTGGETLFLSPGIQWVATPRLIIEGLFQYPLIQDLHGTQLGIDYTVSLGFRYSF